VSWHVGSDCNRGPFQIASAEKYFIPCSNFHHNKCLCFSKCYLIFFSVYFSQTPDEKIQVESEAPLTGEEFMDKHFTRRGKKLETGESDCLRAICDCPSAVSEKKPPEPEGSGGYESRT
jgi:hypothetical protein